MPVSVVIPALNEAAAIGDLVRETIASGADEVIVVDNGSTDGTAAVAAGAGARVIAETRRGYGYACAAGSRVARGDVIVYLDGDRSFDPAQIPLLTEPIERGLADLVLGSRPLGGIEPGAMPPHQRWGNDACSALMSRLYGVRVTDLGPFRAIRADLLRRLAMGEMTYGWPAEMMVKAAKSGARIVEAGVTYGVRRGGKSKVSGTLRGSVLAAYYILGVILRYSVGRGGKLA